MTKRSKSIISVLYMNTLFTLLVFLFIIAAINIVISAQLNSRAVQNGQLMVQGIANYVEQRMLDEEREAREIQSVLLSGIILDKDVDQYLDNITKTDDFIKAIEVISPTGTVVHSAPIKYDLVGMDRSGETFFKNVSSNGGTYWSKIFTFILSGEPIITISQKMDDRILVIYMDANKISGIFTSFGNYMGDSTQLAVMDENGTYITNNNQSVISQREVSDEFTLIQMSIDDDTGSFRSADENALVNVVYVDTFRWYVVIYTSLDYVTRPITNVNNLLYIFVILILALAVFFFGKAKSISASILEFSRQSNKIAAGNYDLTISQQQFRELKILGDDFEQMNSGIVKRDGQLRAYAYIDLLTGLPNRRAIMDLLQQKVERKEEFAVIYFDLDKFKNLNDSSGHYTGDLVLKQIAQRFLTDTPDIGFWSRIGGDEFLYLLSGKCNTELIRTFASETIQKISAPFFVNDQEIYIGMSAGAALFPNDAENVAELLKYSDLAMYAAKARGTNAFSFFTIEMKQQLERKMTIVRNLREAIAKSEFTCFFQPQIELKNGLVIGFEALIRWQNAELGSVPPGEFIQIAEESTLITDITKWMLNEACRDAAALKERYGIEYLISVNASINDMKDKQFPAMIRDTLERSGLSPTSLEIEITENMMIGNFDEVIEVIENLIGQGVRLALDDFGTGYSSLSYLNRLPIHTLKIDKSFIDKIDNKRSYQLITSILDIANKLECKVIAEGIENTAQCEMLIKNQCYGGQGYLMCRPLSLPDLIVFMDRVAADPEHSVFSI